MIDDMVTGPVVNIAVVNPMEYGCAPFWSQKTNALYFVNKYKSEIHKYDPERKCHTFAKVGCGPLSFAIPIEDFNNKFLVGSGNALGAITWDEKSNKISNFKKIELIDEVVNGNRISSGKISPDGVLFVGTSGSGNIFSNDLKFGQGNLYGFKNCELKRIISNISVPGGMAWDRTGHSFYFTDCAEYRIERYCYNKESSDLTKGCILYEFKDDQLSGFPCDMTVDCEDHLWVACFNGGQVIKINVKTGKAIAKIELPDCPQVTSVVFGGKNLDSLFITSACYKIGHLVARNAGCVFQISGLGVRGYPSQPLRLLSSQQFHF